MEQESWRRRSGGWGQQGWEAGESGGEGEYGSEGEEVESFGEVAWVVSVDIFRGEQEISLFG